MITRIGVALALLLATSRVVATPWVAYGQNTMRANSNLDNPQVNLAGTLEEVALPYIVPEGMCLTIEGWGVEGVGSRAGLIPWLGYPPATNPQTLPTATSLEHTSHVFGRWILGPGTVLNVRLVYTGRANGTVIGWHIWGTLNEC